MSEISEETRRVLGEIGSIITPKKTAASRETIAIARGARRDPKPCLGPPTCEGGVHKQPCPVYFREMQARRRGNKNSLEKS